MNISIASDHAGFEQKTALAAYLRELGHQVTDLGPDTDERVDYPDFAALVARDVAAGTAERGVLVCGTGIGMAVAANKVQGIRALISYEGSSAAELVADFHTAVDDYLDLCRQTGQEPEKAYKGSFNVRISPQLHQDAVRCAISRNTTLNAIVEQALQQYVPHT